ncbi:MAG TPA: ATP-binding cassette domain-containing protein [Devosiaceae bacterium]
MSESGLVLQQSRRPEQQAIAGRPLVRLQGITKAFGATLANSQIDLEVREGDIIGLVGGNGAGKSTLMRILSGAIAPTLGTLSFGDETVGFADYGTGEAQRRGIRMVHQEFSLCTNLSVAENFYIEAPEEARMMPGWRRVYQQKARDALEMVFPGFGLDVNTKVGDLGIGERQMVEIARAAASPGLKLVVLDEPTSSLDQERSRQLRAFMHARSREGLAFIFISHKLHEIVDIATKVVVLRNGSVAWQGAAAESSFDHLVELMGGDAGIVHRHAETQEARTGDTVVRIGGRFTTRLGRDVDMRRGEIVGLAGLEGSGQKELLHAIFAARKNEGDVVRTGSASFIAGDRRKEGVFALGTVLFNIFIGRIAKRGFLEFVSQRREAESVARHADDLKLDRARFQSNILELSGGNQQKALVARALAAETPVVLLDDPTRGVDISTKQDFYRLCNQAAKEGHTLVWHTTEDAELLAADRVLVFADGEIVSELVGAQITEEAIVGASFAHQGKAAETGTNEGSRGRRLGQTLLQSAPFLGMVIVLGVMMLNNPAIASVFGLDLLLMPAVSLVLVAMAQMYIVGGSEIDLGVGAFAGLVSVLSATLLYDYPLYGVAAILLGILAYSALGWLIHARRIPAIVVTLGASFIWAGIGYSIQPTPGGASPSWLSAAVNWSVFGLPTSILLIVVIGAIATILNQLPLGVALRGFGNNAAAMVNSGWSATRFAMVRYLVAGVFAAAAGMSLTAINTASDINSGNSYTLLSVAAVVMGGCALMGGIVSPIGAVAGAVTLALIGALLGVLNVSSDYNAMAQGLVLIALLALRAFAGQREGEE